MDITDDYDRMKKREFRRERVDKIVNISKEGYNKIKDSRLGQKYSTSLKPGRAGGSMSGSFSAGARRVSKVRGLRY